MALPVRGQPPRRSSKSYSEANFPELQGAVGAWGSLTFPQRRTSNFPIKEESRGGISQLVRWGRQCEGGACYAQQSPCPATLFHQWLPQASQEGESPCLLDEPQDVGFRATLLLNMEAPISHHGQQSLVDPLLKPLKPEATSRSCDKEFQKLIMHQVKKDSLLFVLN